MLPAQLHTIFPVVLNLCLTIAGIAILYVILCYLLRQLFRRFERDLALVTLNVSVYPVFILFELIYIKVAIQNIEGLAAIVWLDRLFTGSIIVSAIYWSLRLFKQVIIYYLKEYTEATEAMWDEVLIPSLEGAIPVFIVLAGGSAILQFCFGLDLTGIGLTIGGVAVAIGFAIKDIIANFFSGIVLLIDAPFQFGDVLSIGGEIGILQKIGVRVTRLYMVKTHTEVHIPNSVIQGQAITNLNRPIEPVYISTQIQLDTHCDLERAQQIMQCIIQAHPDTLGDIENKLTCLDQYYNWEGMADSFAKKKENGRQRLLAENAVNEKLEEIEQALEALSLTLKFVEKGGLTQDEIQTIQHEYDAVLKLMGLAAPPLSSRRQRSVWARRYRNTAFQLKETQDPDALIKLVRDWYQVWLRDPNLLVQDEYVLSDVWERKINLLQRRVIRLYRKILRPVQEETRLDEHIHELVLWLRERFKQARSAWQEPTIRMDAVIQASTQFTLNYYVDDIRLEDGERGTRVNSDIHREIMRLLKEEDQ